MTDDLEAIVEAHDHANRHGLRVEADEGATYYIGGADRTALIQTDTDFGSAEFQIDDRSVQNRRANIFEVRSALQPFRPKGVSALEKNQQGLPT